MPVARASRPRWLGLALAAVLAVAGCHPVDLAGRTGFAGPGELITMPSDQQRRELDLVAATGVAWIRLEINWRLIQPSGPGSWSWTQTDTMVRRALQRGLRVIGLLVDTPRWASVAGCDEQFCAPRSADEFATFARAVVHRYGPQGVRVWQVWNEPNKSVAWKPKPNLDAYAQLLIRTSAEIKAVDRDATVLTGGTAPAADTPDGSDIAPVTFVRGLYARGAKNAFDAVAHHPYAFQYPLDTDAPWNAWKTTEWIHQVMAANGDGHKQVWGTEVGAPTGTDPGFAVSEAQQAAVINEQLRAWSRWPFTGPLLVFSMRDTGDDPRVWVLNMGLVRRDFSAKPALATLTALTTGGRLPSYPANGVAELVRIGGDPSTHALVGALARLWNHAPGCVLVGPPGAPPLDGTCADLRPEAEGIQVGYQLDSDGRPAGDENPDHDVAVVLAGIGTDAAFTQLLRGGEPGIEAIDVVRAGREPRSGDPRGLRFVTYGRHGAGWITFPGAADGVTALSSVQLARVFGGCGPDAGAPAVDLPANGGNGNGRADWGDLGGQRDAPIVVFAPRADSPSRQLVEQVLGIDMTACIPNRYKDGSRANGERILAEDRPDLVRGARPVDCALEVPNPNRPDPCTPLALGVMSVGTWLRTGGGGARMGAVRSGTTNVSPTEAAVVGGTYPLARPQAFVFRRPGSTTPPSSATRQLADVAGFVCRPPAQHARDPRTEVNYGDLVAATLRDHGVFPLPVGPSGPGLPESRCRVRDVP